MTAATPPRRPRLSAELVESLLGPHAGQTPGAGPAPVINIQLAPGAVLVIGHYTPPGAGGGHDPKGGSDVG